MHTFTPQQEQVLALISAGSTISGAASSAGVHRNTIHNWLRSQPAFHAALARARYGKAMFWREQAESLAAAALETISATMSDPSVPPSVRLKAAQSILALVTTPPPKPPVPEIIEAVPFPEATASAEEPLSAPEIVHNSAQPPNPPAETIRRASPKIGRNDLCPCGSGKKFKRCCLNEDGLPGAPVPMAPGVFQ
jgi:transposase-like protein